MRCMHLVAATLLAALCLPATHAHAKNGGFYAGPYLLAGATTSSGVTRVPSQPGEMRDGSDFLGLSGGFGGWGGYNFERELGVPISLEFASSARARHDQDIGFIDVTTNRLYSIKSNISTVDNMLSVLYDLPVGKNPMLQPYVGVGGGVMYAHLSQKAKFVNQKSAGNENAWDLSWQVQGGLKYPIYDDLSLRLDYRYVDLGKVSTGILPTGTSDRFDSRLVSHDLRFGLMWLF